VGGFKQTNVLDGFFAAFDSFWRKKARSVSVYPLVEGSDSRAGCCPEEPSMTSEELSSWNDYALYLLGTEPRRLEAAARGADPAHREEYLDRAERARGRANQALTVLIDRYHDRLYHFLVRKVLRNAEQRLLAEDAVLRAFCQLWLADDIEPRASLYGYLKACARCRALDLIRSELHLRAPRPPNDPDPDEPAELPPLRPFHLSRRRGRPVDPATLENLPAREETPLALLTATEEPLEDPHLRKILDGLGPVHRLIVEWMYDGSTADEVLERLGWPPEHKGRLYRMLHGFRTRYLRQHPDRVRLVRAEVGRLRRAARAVCGDEAIDAIEQELNGRTRPGDVVHLYRMVHRTRKRLHRQSPAEQVIELNDLVSRLRLDAASPHLQQQVQTELSRLDEELTAGQRGRLATVNQELHRRKLLAEALARVGRELFRIRRAFQAGLRRQPSRMLVTLSLELALYTGNDQFRTAVEGVRALLLNGLRGPQAQRARQLLHPLLQTQEPAVWLRLLRLGKQVQRQRTGRQQALLAGMERICRTDGSP
jgi:DNA-directed RNA polymerase specialized sigma24 family protein